MVLWVEGLEEVEVGLPFEVVDEVGWWVEVGLPSFSVAPAPEAEFWLGLSHFSAWPPARLPSSLIADSIF